MLDAFSPDSLTLSDVGLKAKVGPLVLEVECAERDAQRLIEAAEGAEVYCQLETDDGDFHLVGFASENRRELYRALRRVSGIGRRSALVVLDCGEAVDILRAVSGKDKAFFRSVPGVGEKRIAAIVRELEKRFKGALPKPVPVPVATWVEARDALLAHVLDPHEADRLLRQAVEGLAGQGQPDAAALYEKAQDLAGRP